MESNLQSIPLPPPYQGQNDRFPLLAQQNPFAEKMYNWDNLGGITKVRNGNTKKVRQTDASLCVALNVSSYDAASPLLLLLVELSAGPRWYNITSGVLTLVHSLAAGAAIVSAHTLFFNGYLFYFGEGTLDPTAGGTPQYYNGTAWGASTYTWPSGFNPFGGGVYKNRAYFIKKGSAAFGYSEIDLISGTVTEQNLASLVSSKAELRMIRAVSMSENVEAQTVNAFFFSNGELIVYAGQYPKARDWDDVGRFRVGKPLDYNSFVEAKGDVFIFTDSEILSIRGLMARGYEGEKREGIGAAIKNRWKQIVTGLKATFLPIMGLVKGVYDEENDRIVIQIPLYVDPTTGAASNGEKSFQLIYDFVLEAWYEYFQTESSIAYIAGACYHDDFVYWLAQETGEAATVMKLNGASGYLDDQFNSSDKNTISHTLRSMPHPISRFGKVQTVGIEAIVKSDIYSSLNCKLIGDLGAAETGTVQASGNGSNLSNVFFDLGIDANVVQYEFSGETATSTVGIELSATNLWISPSTEGVGR